MFTRSGLLHLLDEFESLVDAADGFGEVVGDVDKALVLRLTGGYGGLHGLLVVFLLVLEVEQQLHDVGESLPRPARRCGAPTPG